jgi:cyclopropane fatty-acyl-phospholipid synthase-like methyltransferase
MQSNLRLLKTALILLLTATGACAPDSPPDAPAPAAIPPAPETYMGRRIATTMHYTGAPWLTRESREREEDTRLLLETLKVEPGTTICDMGCGNGFYTLQLARLTGEEGTVYAVDIQPEMLDLLRERAGEAGIENIEPTLGTVVDPKLPAGSIDLILCVDVYHEMSHPEQMLAAMRTALEPDGRLVLVEFRAEDPDVPIKPLHKMSKEQVLEELVANGFRQTDDFEGLPMQHMMTFGVDPAWKPAP